MPVKSAHLCSCGKVVPGNIICPCVHRRKAEADQRRPTANARGYGSRWSKARAGHLLSHPTCVMVINGEKCGKPASVCDHIKPHRGNQSLFWDKANWQSLCTHHHSSTKQSIEHNTKQDT